MNKTILTISLIVSAVITIMFLILGDTYEMREALLQVIRLPLVVIMGASFISGISLCREYDKVNKECEEKVKKHNYNNK